MKKMYRIRFVDAHKSGIWYASKIGVEYDAELGARGNTEYKPVVFFVNPCQFVYPVDCIVVKEWLVKSNK